MTESGTDIWNKDNTEVLPQFQLTYGHAIFRTPYKPDWHKKLFNSLKLGRPFYRGELNTSALPFRPEGKFHVLSSKAETHLIIARIEDVWAVFAPHDLCLSNDNWVMFNKSLGGLMASASQIDGIGSYFYYIFKDGRKQVDVIAENGGIRIIPNDRFIIRIKGNTIYDHRTKCLLSEAEIRDFIHHDLAISVRADRLFVSPRFVNGAVDLLEHFIFRREKPKRLFF